MRRKAVVTRVAALAVLLAVLAGCGPAGATATRATSPPPVAAPELPACSPGMAGAAAPAPAAGARLPDVTLPCLGPGGPVPVRSLTAGTPTVVNLWASWCAPCRQELPAFQSVAAGAGNRLRVLGVLSRDPGNGWRDLVRATGVAFPSLRDDDATLLAWSGSPGLPVTLFLRGDGTVAYRKYGAVSGDRELAALVREHLGVAL